MGMINKFVNEKGKILEWHRHVIKMQKQRKLKKEYYNSPKRKPQK